MPDTNDTPPRARSSPDWRGRFLAALGQIPNVSVACEQARVARKTAYRAREASPKFAAQWDEALTRGVELLEAICWKRATVGPKHGVWRNSTDKDGNSVPVMVEEVAEPSDVLAIFLLKAHAPDKYRENIRAQISGPDGGPIAVVDATPKIHPDVLRQVIALADAHAANTSGSPASGDVGQITAPPK